MYVEDPIDIQWTFDVWDSLYHIFALNLKICLKGARTNERGECCIFFNNLLIFQLDSDKITTKQNNVPMSSFFQQFVCVSVRFGLDHNEAK